MNYATNATNQAPPNYRTMSDSQLLLEIDGLTADAQFILEQLKTDQQEGHPSTSDWRRRAQSARARKLANLKLAEDEYARRNGMTKSDKVNERIALVQAEQRAAEARRAERITAHEANQAEIQRLQIEKEIKRLEAEAEKERRKASLAGMFMAAAYRCFSPDDIARIFVKAREMFPDALDLEPSP